MGDFDPWILAAVLCALALFASLRLSLPEGGSVRGGVLDIVTHPTWLIPLIIVMGFAVGLMIRGQLSPWPPEASAEMARQSGRWAGVTGFMLVAIVDLWMLWTPSMVARRFARPESHKGMRLLPYVNLAFGAVFLGAVAILTR